MKTLFVGMTGGIGSGKSTVMRLFEKLGITCIDTDDIARDVVNQGTQGLEGLIEHFGSHILNDDQTLNRAKLRSMVFSDEKQRIWLNEFLHPLIQEELFLQAQKSESVYTILIVPLLIESAWHTLMDRVLVVDVSEPLQIERASSRDKSTAQDIQNIMQTQVSRAERCQYADDIIDNDGTILELEKQVLMLDKKYRLLAQT